MKERNKEGRGVTHSNSTTALATTRRTKMGSSVKEKLRRKGEGELWAKISITFSHWRGRGQLQRLGEGGEAEDFWP